MGGNGWYQTGPYQQDLAAAFRQAQEEELAKDDHGFPGMTMDERWADPRWQEYILTGGTASVLDQVELIPATSPKDGPFLRPLTGPEIRTWCPSGRPTRDDWLAAMKSDALEYPDRAAANCTILYENDQPTLIAYWGVTAD
jgi:hypothetical protein